MKIIEDYWAPAIGVLAVVFFVLLFIGVVPMPNFGRLAPDAIPTPTCSIPWEFRTYEDGGYDKYGDPIIYCVWDQDALDAHDREVDELLDGMRNNGY